MELPLWLEAVLGRLDALQAVRVQISLTGK